MVDSVFIYMGSSLGSGHDAAAEYIGEVKTLGIYDIVRSPWFSVRNLICAGTGNPLWTELSRDDSLDYSGAALGFYPRYQQFFLRDANCTDNFGIENGGKKRNGYGIENVEVQKRGK